MSIKLSKSNTPFCLAVALLGLSPCFADDEGPAPGPALEARQKLFERIQQAKAQGIGIGGYLQAFRAMEAQVKGGDSDDKINSRVESIHKAVSDQIDRAKVLKTQRPIPPQGSQITGSDPIAQPGPGPGSAKPVAASGEPGAPGGLPGAGELPGGLKSKLDALPDSIKDRLMNDPNIIEKIKARAGGGGQK